MFSPFVDISPPPLEGTRPTKNIPVGDIIPFLKTEKDFFDIMKETTVAIDLILIEIEPQKFII